MRYQMKGIRVQTTDRMFSAADEDGAREKIV